MVLFLLIGSFEKVDQPTPPPDSLCPTKNSKDSHTTLQSGQQNFRIMKQNSRFESLSIDWKIMKIEICFTNQKMKMEVFEWVDLKKVQTQIESTFID